MGFYSGTIQKGSKGSDVKYWQEYLNSQGANLSVDGVFGDNTYAATVDWQNKNGLTGDGVVGTNTWSKAGFKDLNTPVDAPNNTGTMPTAPTLNYTSWLDTTEGQSASKNREDAETALNSLGDFNYLNQDWMNQVLSDIKNRKDFSYNLDEDALYQQYKDKYIKQGKLAMADTIGQASAMTGGYGNSYAQSVGNQAYQASLENLNDIVPELYQMAYDKYNNETQELYNQYGMLLQDYAREYGEHSDEYNKLLSALERADNNYYQGATLHNTEQSNANTVAQNNFQNEFNVWDAQNTEAWNKAQWDEAARQYQEQKVLSQAQNSTGGGGNNIIVDENGNLKIGNTTTSLPSDVLKKFEGFTSNEQIQDYALELIKADYDEAEVDKIVAKYLDPNEKYSYKTVKDADGTEKQVIDKISYGEMAKSTQEWKVLDDGGGNLFGIDKDARVEAPNGEQMTLKQLRNRLVNDEKMSTSEANKLIKKLQQNLGISSNFLFGW